jgi:hypothetical protein
LFGASIDSLIYFYLFSFCFVFLVPSLFILEYKSIENFYKEEFVNHFQKIPAIILKFILLPIVTIYSLILLAFSITTLSSFDFPDFSIIWLMISLIVPTLIVIFGSNFYFKNKKFLNDYPDIKGIGIDNIKKYANLFGYGELSGIDLPNESRGFIPTEAWKEETLDEAWYIGNTYHSSIGQGYTTATPLQVLNSVAIIANGGTLYKPKIVSQIKKDGGVIYNKAEVIRNNFIAPDILETVREGMRMTVTEGTAQSLNSLPVAVAGKTGTAQFGSEGKAHGWFVSFAPYENPEIAMVVLVEGEDEETGYTAVPVTNEVYKWYFSR